VYISVNYKAEVIIQHFGNGSQFGLKIDYLHEKEKLGTAGSLALLPEPVDEPILVMNGDVVSEIDYQSLFAFHVKHRWVMTVAATEYKVKVPFGTLEIANQFLLRVSEKPDVRFHCNAGIYALQAEALQYIPPGRSYDMTTLIGDLIHYGLPISVFPVHEYWMDIGRHEDLKTFQSTFSQQADV
jgi:NDP-sugar pyrophosphorylase family protein